MRPEIRNQRCDTLVLGRKHYGTFLDRAIWLPSSFARLGRTFREESAPSGHGLSRHSALVQPLARCDHSAATTFVPCRGIFRRVRSHLTKLGATSRKPAARFVSRLPGLQLCGLWRLLADLGGRFFCRGICQSTAAWLAVESTESEFAGKESHQNRATAGRLA
jgi:hypothetical protein